MDIKFHCDETSLFPDGIKVQTFNYKNYSIDEHNHDFYEVNIVMAGTGVHCIESGRFPARRGDVFVIPPLVAHAYVDTKDLEVYHIVLKRSFMEKNKKESEQVKGFLELTEIEPFLRSNSFNAFFLHLTQPQMLQVEEDLKFLDGDGHFSWEEFSAMKYHVTWKILYWFAALLQEQIKNMEAKTGHPYEVQIIRTLEFIHRNYSRKVTIEGLCKESCMSRSTFIRSFRSICGMPPMEYLNQYRCKKAAELLEAGKDTKTEVAHSCGFYDLSHMERMLKK